MNDKLTVGGCERVAGWLLGLAVMAIGWLEPPAWAGVPVVDTARTLEVLVPELATRDLAAMMKTAGESGDAAAARWAQETLQRLHLDYAGRLQDPPAGAAELRKSFDTLPRFYETYEEQPRRETPDKIFAKLQSLGPDQAELPLISPDDQLYVDGATNAGVWRMVRHSFTLPAKPVKGWLQTYSRGWNYYVNGHDYGWMGGASGDVIHDITADLRPGENLLVIADAWLDRFLVVRGGVLLENGDIVPILSGRGVWEINTQALEKPVPEATKPETMKDAKLVWEPAKAGHYDESFYRRQPLRWQAMGQITTLRTQGGVTPWQRPSANGPCRVLFACPHFGQSDVVAFAARFDMEVDSLGFGTRYLVDPAAWNACRERRYDLMVVGNTRMDDKIKNEVMRKVREEGMGLLVVGDLDSASWLPNYLGVATNKVGKGEDAIKGVPIHLLHPFRDERSAWADLYEAGKGRVAIVGYPPGKMTDQIHPATFTMNSSLLPNTENMEDAEPWLEDYYHAYLGKLALWAAKRESPIRYETAGPADSEPRVTPGEAIPFRLRLSGVPAGAAVQVSLRLRDMDGRPAGTQEMSFPVTDGKVDAALSLPELAPGTYAADVWLKRAGQVLDWHTTLLTLRGEEVLGAPRVEVLTGRHAGQVRVTCDVASSKTEQGDIVAVVTDARFRALVQVPLRVAGGKAEAEFAVPPETTPLAYCRVERRDGPHVLESRSTSFGVPPLERKGAFTWVMWPWLPWERYAELGVDTVITQPPLGATERLAKTMAQYGLRASLFVWRVSEVDLDPTTWAYSERLKFQSLNAFRPYGLVQANLGDDTGIRLFDAADGRYADAFRGHLQRRHGDIATLNKRWGSAYASWQDVPVLTPDQLRKGDAKQAPLAMETRRFLQDYMKDSIQQVTQRVRRHCPGIVSGIEGALANSLSSVDWEGLGPKMDMVCSYPWEWAAELPAFARKDALVGSWTGSYDDFTRDPHQLLQQQWYLLLNGYNSAFHWYGSSGVTDRGNEGYVPLFCPDGRMQPEYRDTVDAVRRLKDGLYPLLHHAQVRRDGVGILYSFDSVLYLHDEANQGGFPEPAAALRGTWSLLEECGFFPQIVTTRQVDAGELESLGVKVLILPSVICLTAKDRAGLQAFAAKGGTLVADLRPGLRDEYGAPVPATDPIFALFGYTHDSARSARVFGEAKLPGKVASVIPAVCADQGVTHRPGTTAGDLTGVPVWIERPEGQGKVILLNLSLATYSPPTGWPGQKATYYRSGSAGERAAAWRALVSRLLADVGVRPRFEIVSAGKPAPVVLRLYENGPITYATVLRSADFGFGGDRSIQVRLPKEAHVYDSMAGTYLGKTARVDTELRAGKLLVLACLPYRVTSVDIRPLDKIQRGHSVRFRVDVRADSAAPADHVLTVTRRKPDGTLLPLSEATVVARNGRGEFTAWFGPEDPAGEWTLIATDAATGQAGWRKITL